MSRKYQQGSIAPKIMPIEAAHPFCLVYKVSARYFSQETKCYTVDIILVVSSAIKILQHELPLVSTFPVLSLTAFQ